MPEYASFFIFFTLGTCSSYGLMQLWLIESDILKKEKEGLQAAASQQD